MKIVIHPLNLTLGLVTIFVAVNVLQLDFKYVFLLSFLTGILMPGFTLEKKD